MIRYDRLAKLANALYNEDLGSETFDFGQWTDGEVTPEHPCGTAACAIGQAPYLWPQYWRVIPYNREISLRQSTALSGNRNGRTIEDICAFFGISHEAARHLFIPGHQDPHSYGGSFTDYDASAKDVADNIKAFCETMASKGMPGIKCGDPGAEL